MTSTSAPDAGIPGAADRSDADSLDVRRGGPAAEPDSSPAPAERLHPSLGDTLNARAAAALVEASQMPPGAERAEAMNKAKSLRNAVDMHQHFFSAEGSRSAD
jgi:hypothetical protein